MFQCQSVTKNMEQCKVKVSENSKDYNGKRICHLHLKNILKNNDKQKEQISNENIKSPIINYKIDKKSDCCYICLEETENKLSCGHFIHNSCLLEILQSDVKKNYDIFEHKNNYFIITNCVYCKQVSIIKNVPITDLLLKKYNAKKDKIKINNEMISFHFGELFLKYDTYETKEKLQQIENDFMDDLKQIIFDNFSTIVFDNYIQQKHINLNLKYKKINKKIIMKKINNIITNALYSKYLFDKIQNKLELFFRMLENIILKMIQGNNVQDDLLNLINVF